MFYSKAYLGGSDWPGRFQRDGPFTSGGRRPIVGRRDFEGEKTESSNRAYPGE